LSSSF